MVRTRWAWPLVVVLVIIAVTFGPLAPLAEGLDGARSRQSIAEAFHEHGANSPAPGAVPIPAWITATTNVCTLATRTIYYDVVAFGLSNIPVNGWGDIMGTAYVYALNNTQAHPNKADLIALPALASPLTLRANVGDCVVVGFRNEVPNKRVGMTIPGLSYDPSVSDGTRVGFNADTTVPSLPASPAIDSTAQITYFWFADHEGQFPINDMANTDTRLGTDTMTAGLYGAFITEPQGSTWKDPVSGATLLQDIGGKLTGVGAPLFADIEVPGGSGSAPNDFRDFALIFMDEPENIALAGGGKASTFGFNYRSEPLRNRTQAVVDHRNAMTVTLPNGTIVKPSDNFCDGYDPDKLGGAGVVADQGAKCWGEEVHLQSWPFGDPGKLVTVTARDGITGQPTAIRVDSDNLIPKAYIGDPIRFRIVHPGNKIQHTFHFHQHRWYHEPEDTGSTRLDVQLTGPGQAFELRIEAGAGSGPGVPGDAIFHCHLYTHFADGFWGTLRTFDRLRDGSQKYPDGTPIQALRQLSDRVNTADLITTPAPTVNNPGFPLFVKGQYLQKAYRPPNYVKSDPYRQFRRAGDTVRGPSVQEAPSMAGNNGKPGNPNTSGVFYADPCPPSAPQRTYYPQSVDADPENAAFNSIVYNDIGNGTGTWQDPDGRVYIELSAMSKIMDGTERPEPYTIRANHGDCANIEFTNRTHEDDLNRAENAGQDVPLDIFGDGQMDLYGQTPFHGLTKVSEVSIHTHLFMYDLLGSDGTSVGWNYDISALVGQTVGLRFWVDMPLRTVYFHDHQTPATGQPSGLYAVWNVEPTGSTYQKIDGSASTFPELTNGFRNYPAGLPNLSGASANIIVPGGQSFREYTLFFADSVPGFRPAPDLPGNQGPEGKDLVPASPRRGMGGINYRSEPFSTRINPYLPSADPVINDPAYIMSSAVHGDPSTPVLKAYEGDPVIIRTMQGSNELLHNFHIHGHRWLHEPDDPDSSIYDSQAFNIAEFFNFELDGARLTRTATGAANAGRTAESAYGATKVLPGVGAPGDYLYGSTSIDDLWLGMWGLMRIYGAQVSGLAALPGKTTPAAGDPWPALKPAAEGQPVTRSSGVVPTKAPNPKPQGDPCPSTARQKNFSVGAITKKIVYNKEGDNDPNGLLYVLLDNNGTPLPHDDKPLFIRANEGECVNVTLANLLPTTGIPAHRGDTHPPADIYPRKADGTICTTTVGIDACGLDEENQPEDADPRWPAGKRVSIHPHLLRYDPLGSDGATIGYNYDQTVGPGETITYRWYADTKDLGIADLGDYGDLRGHRHHGLFGGLVVEPRGAVYVHPKTGVPIDTGEAAIIVYPDTPTNKSYREFIVGIQDGLNLSDIAGNLIGDIKGVPSSLRPRREDPIDQGHKGINYRAERFVRRLAHISPGANLESNVFSSDVHGDPATPVFEAFAGDKVMVRVFNPQDKATGHVFNVHGHNWRHEMKDSASMPVNAQGGLNTGRAFNMDLIGGAGGVAAAAGDYLLKCNIFGNHLSNGLWSILRVHPAGSTQDLKPLGTQPPLNVAPTLSPDLVTIPMTTITTTINVLGNDTDANSDTMTVITATQGLKGTTAVAPDGASITYAPLPGLTGADTFNYTVSDGWLTSTGAVTVTIQRQNRAPLPVDDTVTVPVNSFNNVINVLANDSDPDGDTVWISSVGLASHGTRAFGQGGLTIAYSPESGYTGADSFTYTIADGTVVATGTVTLNISPQNRAPVAADDAAAIPVGSGTTVIRVLANDGDPDGNPLKVASVSQPAHGSAVIGDGGLTVHFSPAAGFSGTDSFTYTVSDGLSTTTGRVNVTVHADNRPPAAANDTAVLSAGSVNNLLRVLSNDQDPDGDSLTITSAGLPSGGSVGITPGGSALLYTPNAGFTGSDVFTYAVSDGAAAVTATVTVTVQSANQAPVAVDDTVRLGADSVQNPVNVLANDSDPDGNPIVIVSTGPAPHGHIGIAGNGASLVYTPHGGYAGIQTFTYTISDGSATATATVTVRTEFRRMFFPLITGRYSGTW